MNRNPDRRTRSGPVIAAALLLALAVGYPLSIGPMAMIYGMTGQPELIGSAIDVAYAPLGLLPKCLSGPIMDWANFCMELTL
ncbi:MAG TPA: hypothetical protein VGN42_28235 [Pirellulales bacterium]|jgi:hypothetical protein|nr:hypothetical protein [Pirellulales bacterium]